MAMPKKQMTSTRSGNRRSQINLSRPATTVCSNCKAVIKPHTVCAACGFYKDKKVTLAK
jgi:large subunit ribosomal protein L32